MPAKFKTPWKQEGGPIGIAATELARTTPRAPPAAAVKRFWIVSWTGRYHGGAKPKSWQGDGVLVQHGLKCILYDTHEKRRLGSRFHVVRESIGDMLTVWPYLVRLDSMTAEEHFCWQMRRSR